MNPTYPITTLSSISLAALLTACGGSAEASTISQPAGPRTSLIGGAEDAPARPRSVEDGVAYGVPGAYDLAHLVTERTGTGLWLHAVDGRLQVFFSVAGSPAERAGLEPGFEVLSIDGARAAGRDNAWAFDRLGGEVGSSHELQVRDWSGDTRKVTLEVASYPRWNAGELLPWDGRQVFLPDEVLSENARGVADLIAAGKLNAAQHLVQELAYADPLDASFKLVGAWLFLRQTDVVSWSFRQVPENSFENKTPYQEFNERLSVAIELDETLTPYAAEIIYGEVSRQVLAAARSRRHVTNTGGDVQSLDGIDSEGFGASAWVWLLNDAFNHDPFAYPAWAGAFVEARSAFEQAGMFGDALFLHNGIGWHYCRAEANYRNNDLPFLLRVLRSGSGPEYDRAVVNAFAYYASANFEHCMELGRRQDEVYLALLSELAQRDEDGYHAALRMGSFPHEGPYNRLASPYEAAMYQLGALAFGHYDALPGTMAPGHEGKVRVARPEVLQQTLPLTLPLLVNGGFGQPGLVECLASAEVVRYRHEQDFPDGVIGLVSPRGDGPTTEDVFGVGAHFMGVRGQRVLALLVQQGDEYRLLDSPVTRLLESSGVVARPPAPMKIVDIDAIDREVEERLGRMAKKPWEY